MAVDYTQEIKFSVISIIEKLKQRYGARFATGNDRELAVKAGQWIGLATKNQLTPVILQDAHTRLMANPRYRDHPPLFEDYLREAASLAEVRTGKMGEAARYMPVLDEIHARYRSLYGHLWGYQAEDMKLWAALAEESKITPDALLEASKRWPQRPGQGSRPPTAPQLRDLAYFAQAGQLPSAEEAWRLACHDWRDAAPEIQEARRRMGNFTPSIHVDEFVRNRFVEAYIEVIRDVAVGTLQLSTRRSPPDSSPQKANALAETSLSQFVQQLDRMLADMGIGKT